MSCPSPPPPYTPLSPPPYTRAKRKFPSRTPRLSSSSPRSSSREMLSEALQRAQHAVKLDMAESNFPAVITAYDEAIALLQRVISRRSQKSANTSEVKRVTDILNRYADRVRELCHTHSLPLPSHVAPARTEVSPTKPTMTMMPTSSPLPHRRRHASSDLPPALPTRPAFLRPLTLKPQPSPTSDSTEWESRLSPPSSTWSKYEMPSPTLSIGGSHDDDHRWILSAARDEELREWGQYLDGQ